MRGGKYSAYDGGTRVPFIVRWPGEVKPGVSDAPVSQVDLLASFAAMTGLYLLEIVLLRLMPLAVHGRQVASGSMLRYLRDGFDKLRESQPIVGVLLISVFMMCGGSLLIACLPTYASIGTLAPGLLLLARLLQGLSVGGEYGTSATYMSEVAIKGRRGFFASFQYVTLIGGQLLASLVLVFLQAVMTGEQLTAWGWRIPFFIGAGLAIVALYLRRSLAEPDGWTAGRTRTVNRFSKGSTREESVTTARKRSVSPTWRIFPSRLSA